MSKKLKKFCSALNYIEHLLILTSSVTGCISISAFASLVGIPLGIRCSVVGLKIRAIIAGIKTYKSIIKKNKKKHDNVVLLIKPNFPFASLVGISIGIRSSVVELKIHAITAEIKKYKLIIKKKKKHDKIVLLTKAKLNTIEVLTSRVLIDSCINHDEFVLVNNLLREYGDMKEAIKNTKTLETHQRC